MFEILFKNITDKVPLTEEEKSLAKSFFTPKKLRKKQFFLQEGDVCKYIAFVEKGLMRTYSINEKGQEYILQFASEGWWTSDLYSYLTSEPSVYNIEALEDCELLLITHQSWEELLEKIPILERYFRILIQNSLIITQRKLVCTIGETAEEKYNRLIDSRPDYIQRVPQHMIASYLGITRETLSRIRSQMAARK